MTAPGSRADGRKQTPLRWPLLMVGALVLVGWVVLLGQVERSVFGRVPVLDEVHYLDRAAAIGAGQIVPDDAFFMSPLYPLLVAISGGAGGVPAAGVFAGPELRGLRLVQSGCWLGTLILVGLLARRLVPPACRGRQRVLAQWLPVGLLALYRPAMVFAMSVLAETPLVFLVVLSVWLLTRQGVVATHPGWALLTGVVLGLAALLRGTMLLLIPLAMVVIVNKRQSGRRRLAEVGLLALGAVVVLAPPVVHNSRLAGRLTPPSLNGGVNLFIGNGSRANGLYMATSADAWRRDPAGREIWAERLGRDDVSLVQADRLWAGEAWRHMRDDPLRTLGLFGRKVWLQLQGWEIDQLTPQAGWAASVPLLRPLLTPYALVVVLGLAGATGLRGNRTAKILLAVAIVLVAGQSLFFVVSRYRLVLVPLWAAPAGVGAVQLLRRGRAAWTVAALAAVVTVPWGLNGVRDNWAAQALANEATRWADVGAADSSSAALLRAESLYRRAVTAGDNRPVNWRRLAAVLAELDRPDEQAQVLREAISQVSDPLELQKILLASQLRQNQTQAALALARDILQDAPEDADTLHNYSVLLARSGQPDQALVVAEQLRRSHPTDPRGHIDVGVLLARAGRLAEAKSAFVNGLKKCPQHPDLLRNLSLLGD